MPVRTPCAESSTGVTCGQSPRNGGGDLSKGQTLLPTPHPPHRRRLTCGAQELNYCLILSLTRGKLCPIKFF